MLPYILRGEASKAAVFRRLFTAMQHERASWRRSFNHKIRSAGRKKKVVQGQLLRSMYFVDPHMLRLERP